MIINVCDFLDKSVEKFLLKTAFVDGEDCINYKNFSNLTQKVASKILSFSFFKSPVLILLPKSIGCLAAMFGVARSGNFYTVLDDKIPKERLLKIVEVLEPKLLVTLKDSKFEYLGIPTLFAEEFEVYDVDNTLLEYAKNRQIDTDLLYVLFTSGSTGIPKGVCTAQKSVIDFVFNAQETFCIDENEVLANQSPFYFDFSILDIFVSVKAGATLHLLQNPLFAFPDKVMEYLDKHKVSMIFWVTAIMIYFANSGILSKYKCEALCKILFCGEIMPIKVLQEWQKCFSSALFANLYGPTEITDVCSYYIVDRGFEASELLPVGKSFRNTEILLFDDNLKLIAPNVPNKKGEIFVRGSGLSFGYYNEKDKTDSAFIQNPLCKSYAEKIYKTGDIGAYNSYGELVCYGRADNQVKILGHRVELGEIESVIGAHKEVLNNVCLFKDNVLHCLYESSVGGGILLREYLVDKLPSYMIPRKFIRVDSFPYNANGKIDRVLLKESL
ncbi:AMP-binding protein [Helicobacter sp.]|uniref:AMP-binding protein n=1 Tax=Helicobacter sp. TaxID=218 RepID=UPI002A753838|nr:AMP-binding protein [Helicobacter sp.]MDY2584687.1 AMP-binding protein [Helicobacter sp.]